MKNLRNNDAIIIQRPDKGGGVVVLDKSNYVAKLTDLISDATKFSPCASDPTSTIKSKLNDIAKKYKNSETEKYIYKNINRVGEFHPGHLYGLPKLHKDIENPPLRPIISMSGTITHNNDCY